MKRLNTTTNPTTEQDDLLITPYLNNSTLPRVIQDTLAFAQTDDQRDMLLIASLTSISAILPHLSFRYGTNGKRYYANLQTFIMAAAASGKGIAGLGRDLVKVADEASQFVIPGDSSYPAFFAQLALQQGRGLLFETEGSVITDTWRSGARSYNTALRQAAEHETIARARAGKDTIYITNPQLSCLITGTFDQFHALVPSVQNGFFSRLTCYINRSMVGFQSDVFQSLASGFQVASGSSMAHTQLAMRRLYESLARRKDDLTFCLTPEQIATISTYFSREYGTLIQSLGQSFHASVVRMGITCARIMMILSALRAHEAGTLNRSDDLIATDDDFRAALLIAGKLLLHAADAFTQIDGDSTCPVPKSRTSVQRATFLAQLPDKFTTGECAQMANNHGICRRTMESWLVKWLDDGTLSRAQQGIYTKTA